MTQRSYAPSLHAPWPLRLILVVATVAADARPTTAMQYGPATASPAVPGFVIPPAPRDPEYPLLLGTIAPLETASDRQATPETQGSASDQRIEPVILPIEETWDRSAEIHSHARSRASQLDVNDSFRAWNVGITLSVVLAAVAVMAAVIVTRASRIPEPPVPVVHLNQPGRRGS